MASVDIITTISNTRNMIFRCEILRRSLVKYSNLDFNFHVVVTTDSPISKWLPYYDKSFTEEIRLKNYSLVENSFIWRSNCHWKNHMPVRWYVPCESNKIIFIDSDIIVVGDLSESIESKEEDISGVPIYSSNIPISIWKKHILENYVNTHDWENKITELNYNFYTSITKEFIPACFNFGFLVFNRKNYEEIKNTFVYNVGYFTGLDLDKGNKFAAQLALTSTIFQLSLKLKKLSLHYNCPNFSPKHYLYKSFYKASHDHFKDAKVLHYLFSRDLLDSSFSNLKKINFYDDKVLKHFLEYNIKLI